MHELGHSLGLAHVNAASESGLSGSDQNYTKATNGVDNIFNLGIGADGVRGSSDDARGDDVNLHWFRISNNNPFTIAPTVDSSTYARNTGSLPAGHTFAANGDRTLSGLLGVSNTEAVMQQGTGLDEAQRTLTHDGVATLRYAMAGLDETAGNVDDYTISLTSAGLTSSADIVIDFDNSLVSFAAAFLGGVPINSTHGRITSAAIYFNDSFNWFFNDVSNACSFSIAPTSVSVTSGATSGNVAVTAGAGCAWTAASNDAWITLTSGASGTGNGTVNYSVAANATGSQRVGTVTIAGETFTVTQAAACSYSIGPTAVSVAAAGVSSTVAVTAGTGCAWTAVSNDGFISVTGGASGTGSGTVSYSVATNSLTSQRIGTVTIAGQTFTVTQTAAFFAADPLVAGTPIKAEHFAELRDRIDVQLVRFLQPEHTYTNAITVGGTIRAEDLTEMYTAVNDALTAANPSQPMIAVPTITPTVTIAIVSHINNLRAAVLVLEALP